MFIEAYFKFRQTLILKIISLIIQVKIQIRFLFNYNINIIFYVLQTMRKRKIYVLSRPTIWHGLRALRIFNMGSLIKSIFIADFLPWYVASAGGILSLLGRERIR